MTVLVHRIQLRPDVAPERFERWVREVDYASCPLLPSVLAFSVHRVAGRASEYFEVITVDSLASFERDVTGPVFAELERGFAELATVLDELVGERIAHGYRT